MNGSIPLVSLLSNWYSGATLLTILLNEHSCIVSNGEALPFSTTDYARYECSCGKYLDECEFYKFAAAHMRDPHSGDWNHELFTQVPRFSRNKYMNSLFTSPRFESEIRRVVARKVPYFRRRMSEFLDAQLEFCDNALEYSNASVYLDGTKSPRRAQLFATDSRFRLKVVHLVRDGRAFCYSYMRNKRLGISEKSAAQSALLWSEYIGAVDNYAREFPNIPVLTIRYEDLCHSTRDVLEEIFSFIGVSYEDVTKLNRENRHVLGNIMRKSFTGQITENLEWKQELPIEIQAFLESRLEKDLKRFKYL